MKIQKIFIMMMKWWWWWWDDDDEMMMMMMRWCWWWWDDADDDDTYDDAHIRRADAHLGCSHPHLQHSHHHCSQQVNMISLKMSNCQRKDRKKTEKKRGTKSVTISNTNQTFLIVTPDEKDFRPGMISPTNTVLLAMAICDLLTIIIPTPWYKQSINHNWVLTVPICPGLFGRI